MFLDYLYVITLLLFVVVSLWLFSLFSLVGCWIFCFCWCLEWLFDCYFDVTSFRVELLDLSPNIVFALNYLLFWAWGFGYFLVEVAFPCSSFCLSWFCFEFDCFAFEFLDLCCVLMLLLFWVVWLEYACVCLGLRVVDLF